MYYENFDLKSIVTPVNVDQLNRLLIESDYDRKKTAKLIDGFTNGFELGYQGKTNIQRKAPNLKLAVGNETILWNKVMKEVKEGRFAGPFTEPPFKNFIQSPIGLVKKQGGAMAHG